MIIVIAPLLWLMAGICKAVMDSVCTTIAYNASIFKRRNQLYWDKEYAANNRGFMIIKIWPLIIKTTYRWDAWHNFGSLMLFLQACSLGFYWYAGPIYTVWIDVPWLMGGFFLLGFTPAYSIFKPKAKL